MEQPNFDSITTRVRHLRENITELQKNYDQLTLHVKVSGNVQQVGLDIVQTSIHGVRYAQRMLWKALERPLLRTGSPSVTHKEKEKGQLAEPSQGVPVIEPEQTGSSSNLEETEQQASKPDVSGQPTTSGVKEGEISLRPQKGPRQADTNITGVKFVWLFNNAWESLLKELPDWVCNAVQESWHNNPHLKREDELEIKFITVASEDMTNSIRYPSFHFMKLQRPDHRSANYIKHQETKPKLVVNLTEDEVTTRRAWGVSNSVNGSFLLNTMTGNTTRFANDVFEQKRAMIWENKLIGMENTQRKACNMMHVERWHERICQFCATQEKPLFGRNFLIKETDREKMRKLDKAIHTDRLEQIRLTKSRKQEKEITVEKEVSNRTHRRKFWLYAEKEKGKPAVVGPPRRKERHLPMVDRNLRER
ncbi:hypothetical protein ACS0TY_000938 [Phlomoides rotata]